MLLVVDVRDEELLEHGDRADRRHLDVRVRVRVRASVRVRVRVSCLSMGIVQTAGTLTLNVVRPGTTSSTVTWLGRGLGLGSGSG